jgi:hypothetical protein
MRWWFVAVFSLAAGTTWSSTITGRLVRQMPCSVRSSSIFSRIAAVLSCVSRWSG